MNAVTTAESHASAACRALGAAALALGAGPVAAATLSVQLTLPAIDTASYYRPYLAAWVERDDKSVVGPLAVWYDTRLRDGLGKNWLRQLRTWWRSGGEKLALPADGISGATRPAGTHTLQFGDAQGTLAGLPAGRYHLAVEVAREQGERELLRVPFDWGTAAGETQAQGHKELGAVSVRVQP